MGSTQTLAGDHGKILVQKDGAGVPHIRAAHVNDALYGLGYVHAEDRALQMLLVRILGRGQASQYLQSTEESLQLDRFFRALQLTRDAAQEEAKLDPATASAAKAYCAGINYRLRKKIPWELRFLGYRLGNDLWSIADIFLTAKVVGYVSLAQSQADLERFILQCIHNGVPRGHMEELFPGKLGDYDEKLLRQINLSQLLIPKALQWATALPRMMASNNWVVSGSRMASGKPCLCNDPHLEINRLPPVWYRAVMQWGADAYAIGGTMPGVPGIIIGRQKHLAWGVTYTMADCIDSWIEDCRDAKFRVGDKWLPFHKHTETIYRKGKPPVQIDFYDNHHGILEGDPQEPGLYLATKWSCGEGTSAESLHAMLGILQANDVETGRRLLAQVNNSSWNWVLADSAGNIGYQMSGRIPRRRSGWSGLLPAPGWDPEYDWHGFACFEELPTVTNPPEGFIATANHDVNHWGKIDAINVSMAPYRIDRITQLLSRSSSFDMQQMQELQMDLVSLQAEKFLHDLRPMLARLRLSNTEAVNILEKWDKRYDSTSTGALLFERFYRNLLKEVFNHPELPSFGHEVWDYISSNTGLLTGFFWNFDQIMLGEKSVWFGPRKRDEIYLGALRKAFEEPISAYGESRLLTLRHILFGGKFPPWIGFDRRGYQLPGGRATVNQGQMYSVANRKTSFAPSLRIITDMGEDAVLIAQPGGQSDRRFSRHYNDGTAPWLEGTYQILRPL